MKIVHLIYSLQGGGAEATLYRLCSACTRHEHVVITLIAGGKYETLLAQRGIRTRCLQKKAGGWGWVVSAMRLVKMLWRIRPDAMQTWMYHSDILGSVCARAVGLRRVFWGVHHFNLARDVAPATTILLAHLCARFSRLLPLKVIFCSRASAEVHLRLGYQQRRTVVIPNGYDLSEFYPSLGRREKVRCEVLSVTDVPLLGMVARFDPQKDHDNLLDALHLLKRTEVKFHCVLVGSGMDARNDRLRGKIEALGLRDTVTLLGERDDIPAIMNALDLHVLSSLGEAFPNVLCEAMACGTPCVTTDVGDAAHIVQESGWVVPAGDSVKLMLAISAALAERRDASESWTKRKTLAQKLIVDNYGLGTMVEKYNSVWSE